MLLAYVGTTPPRSMKEDAAGNLKVEIRAPFSQLELPREAHDIETPHAAPTR